VISIKNPWPNAASAYTYILKEKTKPQLLLLHHLAGSFEAAGSEQVISLSGVESIPSELLQSFNYVALGHIHKPQKISRNAYYSGSPIPMRFSETHKKSIRLLELNNGEITSQVILLPEWRKLHILKTNLKDWREDITKLDQPSPLSPVIEIQLELDEPMAGLIDEIKNILKEKGIELLSFIPTYKKLEIPNQKKQKLFELSLPEIFEEFYLHKYPATSEIPIEVKMDFIELIQKAKNAPHSVKD
jgi:exonuclease SbcD